MKRHQLDSDERIIFLSESLANGFLIEFSEGKLDFNEVTRKLEEKAKKIDQIASSKYVGSDLAEYSGRVAYQIINKFAELKRYLNSYNNGDLNNVGELISLLGFLTAEINGLEYTVCQSKMEVLAF